MVNLGDALMTNVVTEGAMNLLRSIVSSVVLKRCMMTSFFLCS